MEEEQGRVSFHFPILLMAQKTALGFFNYLDSISFNLSWNSEKSMRWTCKARLYLFQFPSKEIQLCWVLQNGQEVSMFEPEGFGAEETQPQEEWSGCSTVVAFSVTLNSVVKHFRRSCISYHSVPTLGGTLPTPFAVSTSCDLAGQMLWTEVVFNSKGRKCGALMGP